MPRLLSVYQVAAIFGVSEQTVRRWTTRRLLRSTRTPHGQRFREEDVLAVWRLRYELGDDDATAEDLPAGTEATPAAEEQTLPGRWQDAVPDL